MASKLKYWGALEERMNAIERDQKTYERQSGFAELGRDIFDNWLKKGDIVAQARLTNRSYDNMLGHRQDIIFDRYHILNVIMNKSHRTFRIRNIETGEVFLTTDQQYIIIGNMPVDSAEDYAYCEGL